MRRSSRSGLSIVLLALIAAQPALAFNYPLSPEAIRDAYFLGKGDAARRADFFGKYTRTFPMPKTGPYVATIEFETPFIVIADQVAQNANFYHAPDAEKEFLGKPAICRVLVQVYFPYDDEENVTVQLFQDDKEIAIQSKHAEFLYADEEAPGPVGIEVIVDYAAENVDPDKPAKVEVTLENGTTAHATFDLEQLR
jgi:hypothetical protein